jgi:predicted metalloprotease
LHHELCEGIYLVHNLRIDKLTRERKEYESGKQGAGAMDWTPDNDSRDVEDRRGDSGDGGGFGGGGFAGGSIGIVGFIILLVISLVTGHNFLGAFLHGGSVAPTQQSEQMQPMQHRAPQSSAAEKRDVQLVTFTLNDVQKTWAGIFEKEGRPYTHAKLVLFRGSTYSGCGTAQAATGPFYCPADKKVYIDLNFWDDLKRFGGSTTDFAQAYVIAHELGHHAQDLMGTENKLELMDQREPSRRNHLSVDNELQADCYAGVWAHSAQERGIVQSGDVAAALSAAAAVGDDHLQQMSGRAVSPESWTHGSSAQREHWFNQGFNSGDPASCNTFGSAIQ